MKCTIIVPVYNEKDTICEIISQLKKLKINKEIIVVDDCSSDGTEKKLKQLKGINLIRLNANSGKGKAIRTGLKYATGDVIIIQDGDLEYKPEEIPNLLNPIEKGMTDVVYGSRMLGKGKFSILSYIANKSLTSLTNLLYKTKITDMETCYKCIKQELLKKLDLQAKKFEFEPEITAKLLKKGIKIYEVPISYTAGKNKKIGLKDGIQAIICLIKYRRQK